jgi:hypothetical protein
MHTMTAVQFHDPRLAEALIWKRRRWQAESALEGMGNGALPEWQTPEYLDALEDYHRCRERHRSLIQSAHFDWLHRRCKARGRTLDETLARLKAETLASPAPDRLGLVAAVAEALGVA